MRIIQLDWANHSAGLGQSFSWTGPIIQLEWASLQLEWASLQLDWANLQLDWANLQPHRHEIRSVGQQATTSG
jgi:hypothetical protein